MPSGDDMPELPGGMAVAELTGPDDTWPTGDRRELGWRYLGQRRDKDDVPTFRYAKGDVVVEETVTPVFGPGGHFIRSFHFEGLPAAGLHLRIAEGEVGPLDSGLLPVTTPSTRLLVRHDLAGHAEELVLPLTPNSEGILDLEIEYRW